MKVILYMAMTVNGYIAKENDDTPWSQDIWNGYYDFIKQRGNIILGYRTYEIMNGVNEFEKLNFPFTVVVSDKPNVATDPKIVFVSSPREAMEVIKNKGISEAVVAGGSTLNAGFLKDNLIDEIYLDVEPLIFGRGIPLFRVDDTEAKLELLEVKNLSKNTIRLHYKVIKSA